MHDLFSCLLTETPAPIPARLQNLRQKLYESSTTETPLPSATTPPSEVEVFTITPDMVVLDLITNFPQIKTYLHDLHPLGLLSPNLDKINLELFLSDFNVDVDEVCAELTELIR